MGGKDCDAIPIEKKGENILEHEKINEQERYEAAICLMEVNIAKGNFRLIPVMYLQAVFKYIDDMPQLTHDEIIEKYVEINAAHPFREGNKSFIKNALTDKIGDREVYMNGIGASYYYEGYNAFKTEDL